MDFLSLIVAALLGAWGYYEFFGSPKAQVRSLWRKMHKLSRKLGKMSKETPEVVPLLGSAYRNEIEKTGKMINALLEYHFDPKDEKDSEYIKENRY